MPYWLHYLNSIHLPLWGMTVWEAGWFIVVILCVYKMAKDVMYGPY